ncbi:MAG TPA: tRNA (N(6)-L-threonylcarbamoyladenosine(37)-C(2))-methylthiotransferase MtaB [Bacillota bacterium]|nr:tRNA (N(6)-L-threonylcarbamoyladenosine(37)-C(2))-methylthiotransferase MtaB [Bacillota bacterium]
MPSENSSRLQNSVGSAPTAAIITLGCKVNQYESEAIAERLVALGFDVLSPADACDVYIINTCTVTAEADRKSRQMIRRARSLNPGAAVIVCGCYAQGSPLEVAKIDGVAFVSGSGDKLRVADAALEIVKNGIPSSPVVSAEAPPTTYEPMEISHAPKTRAFVKICDGCDGRCAYCIIPSVRGPVRSRRISDITDEVTRLVAGGCLEVVLTGIETASFGRDTGEKFIDLLRAVDNVPGIRRIRLGSLDPSIMRPHFIEAIAGLQHLCPHFHLSVQSGCSKTLAAMRRRYTAEMVEEAAAALRAAIPRVMLTADVITGFPGETDADFEETLAFMHRMRFLSAHVFAFSARHGTPAATMECQIPPAVRRERSSKLISLQRTITDDVIAEYIAAYPKDEILLESAGGQLSGHTPNFIETVIKQTDSTQSLVSGRIYDVLFTGCQNGVAYAEVI